MAEENEKPLTREDVLRLIEENGYKTQGLDLSRKEFEEGIDLRDLNLQGIILKKAIFWVTYGEDLNTGLLPDEPAHLEGALLAEAHLEGAELLGCHLEKAILVGAHLEGAFLTGVHLEGSDLTGAHLEGTDLRDAHLEGATFVGTHLSSDTIMDGAVWGNYMLGEERDHFFDTAADTYRRLKQWHNNAGMYDVAGKFFYREMEARRKSRRWKTEPHWKLWYWTFRLLCCYGEEWSRVIIWVAAVVFGLALVYFAIGTLTPNTFLSSLYYSAVSFTALGYGSWAPEPTGWVKWLGAFEAFVGVFMMALFLVTFIRKMTR